MSIPPCDIPGILILHFTECCAGQRQLSRLSMSSFECLRQHSSAICTAQSRRIPIPLSQTLLLVYVFSSIMSTINLVTFEPPSCVFVSVCKKTTFSRHLAVYNGSNFVFHTVYMTRLEPVGLSENSLSIKAWWGRVQE